MGFEWNSRARNGAYLPRVMDATGVCAKEAWLSVMRIKPCN